MGRGLTAGLTSAALLFAWASAAPRPAPFMPKAAKPVAVSFPSPGWGALSASWRAPRRGMPVLILAHGVGAGKGEWDRFASRLSARGFGVLALDLRGHGGSALKDGQWRDFDLPGGWAALKNDLLAAAKWVESRQVEPGRVAFAGASIGANLAALADAERPGRFLLLLSPGADYRGVKLALRKGAKTLAVASRSDAYAFATLEALSARGASVLEAPGAHGAPMLDDEATMERVLGWLSAPR